MRVPRFREAIKATGDDRISSDVRVVSHAERRAREIAHHQELPLLFTCKVQRTPKELVTVPVSVHCLMKLYWLAHASLLPRWWTRLVVKAEEKANWSSKVIVWL